MCSKWWNSVTKRYIVIKRLLCFQQDGAELGHIPNTEGQLSLPGSPVLGHSGLRHRRGSGDKTESDSSSSSPASMPGAVPLDGQ